MSSTGVLSRDLLPVSEGNNRIERIERENGNGLVLDCRDRDHPSRPLFYHVVFV
jgi:hypothetical protein